MSEIISEIITLVEGETEQDFVHHIILPHLQTYGLNIRAVRAGNPKRTQHGGARRWESTSTDIRRYLVDGKTLTTLFDFYGLKTDWPGRTEAEKKPWNERGPLVETAVAQAVAGIMGANHNPARFIPCIQVHEFESLLFVNPALTALSLATSGGPVRNQYWVKSLEQNLRQILASKDDRAEAVNDSPQTAPSKRLIQLVEGYDKRAWGVQTLKDVPLPELRAGCRWLDVWLTRLEALAPF